ncbi:SDR family NAD(P)-dependent oxidoreductase [Massilibacteroides sp.]|uniref:SDR family NAD(P)-dependent oxidoreductase n=1 Tax=Massilibacteroides sp. TaxID=2034766 RepID=UPI00260DB578|nr:SDR family NAD(P)-dependent oxidoreductase [Massilibacteroides sp.]MDD4515496.1 SDR family NAD(P)-dependent oxidoreductase [Massilibacteroides sp.]
MTIHNLFDLSSKTALVTGGGQGIGKAIALALAEYGANIIINYRSNTALAEETAVQIRSLGVKCWLWPLDLAEDNITEKLNTFIITHDCPVDILVANASVQIRKQWDQITDEEFATQVNVNLRSTLNLIQTVVPYMKEKQWGKILNIGSVQQTRPHKDMCIYAASKAGLVNLVKNLSVQLAPFGINVNNLAPGVITTARNEEVLANPDYNKATMQKIPLGFAGKPTDCAGLALLLCSDAGKYITGGDFFVDGGMSLFN